MWSIALGRAGKQRDTDFSVLRLEYPQMASWPIPPGASTPYLRTQNGTLLWGSLPVLQYFEETLPNAKLLPESREERIWVRNRALLAMELIMALRPILVAKSEDEYQSGIQNFFVAAKPAEAAPWSSELFLDRIVLSAFATVAASQAHFMANAAWSNAPMLMAFTQRLPQTPLVHAARAARYDETFREFFQAFGSLHARR
jgi:glutathione S-transferase